MSVILTDGFDMYNGVVAANGGLASRWWPSNTTFASVSLVTGRFGGQAVRHAGNNGVQRTPILLGTDVNNTAPTYTDVLVAFAFRVNNISALDWWERASLATPMQAPFGLAGWPARGLGAQAYPQIGIVPLQDGSIAVGPSDSAGMISDLFVTKSTALRSAYNLVKPGTWHYIECRVTFSPTAGSIDLYLDGNLVVSGTGIRTVQSTAGFRYPVNTFVYNIAAGAFVGDNIDLDDLYMTDGNRLGPARIETLVPIADTAQRDWSRSAGSDNYALVDEVPVDTADYVYSATPGAHDLYTMSDLSSTPPTVYAVNAVNLGIKTTTDFRSVYNTVRSGVTDYNGPANTLTVAYQRYENIMNTDPSTGVAWTYTAVNALEAGPKVAV